MTKGENIAMPKKVFRVAYFMNYILQAAFSLLTPAGLLIAGGWLLREKCGMGNWVMITAIVLGVLFGFYSMFYFFIKTMHQIDPTERKGDGHDKSEK